MKRRRWTPEDVAILVAHNDRPAREVAALLGRSIEAVGMRRSSMLRGAVKRVTSFALVSQKRKWTIDEIEFLQSHWGTYSAQAIAKRLNRSVSSVRRESTRRSIAYETSEKLSAYTTHEWAQKLGINVKTIHKQIAMKQFAKRSRIVAGKSCIYNDNEIINWLRQGYAVRCVVNKQTPKYIADVITEVKAQYISNRALMAIDSWLAPHKLSRHRINGIKPTPLRGIKTGYVGDGGVHTIWYRKSDIYERLYSCGAFIPTNIKDPYVTAVRLAWESVYIHRFLLPYDSSRPDHPKSTSYGVYRRADVVAWLKECPHLSFHAHALWRDVVTWQELHADIDRRKRIGQPI